MSDKKVTPKHVTYVQLTLSKNLNFHNITYTMYIIQSNLDCALLWDVRRLGYGQNMQFKTT